MADPSEIMVLVGRLLWWTLMTLYYILESLVYLFVPRQYLRKDVRGQVALVTGGGSGIGRLMCLKLAARGAIVVTWDVSEAGNKETARQVQAAGRQCHAYTVNLADREAVYATAARVKQEVGKVNILINNAGVVTGKKFMESPDDSIKLTFDVNVISNCWTMKAFLGDMIASNKGHIVTVASMAGKLPRVGLVDYCASKYAAVGFHESLHSELKYMGKSGVKATLVCPVQISTGMFQGANSRFFPTLTPDYVAEEVVEAILLNVSTLLLPKFMWIMQVQRLLLPEKANDYFGKSLELGDFMKNFVGRKRAD